MLITNNNKTRRPESHRLTRNPPTPTITNTETNRIKNIPNLWINKIEIRKSENIRNIKWIIKETI